MKSHVDLTMKYIVYNLSKSHERGDHTISLFSNHLWCCPVGDFPTCWPCGASRTNAYPLDFGDKHDVYDHPRGPPRRSSFTCCRNGVSTILKRRLWVSSRLQRRNSRSVYHNTCNNFVLRIDIGKFLRGTGKNRACRQWCHGDSQMVFRAENNNHTWKI